MDGQVVLGMMILGLIAIFYFLPAVIASQRGTEHQGGIFLINLLFGWTILGWIAALIWAVVEAPKQSSRMINSGKVKDDRPWPEPLYK